MPLWSFYLVKVYAWRTILSGDGVLNWALDPIGLSVPARRHPAVWLVESYLWLPFMILPIYAGLERIPQLAAQRLRGPRRLARARPSAR